MSSEEWEAIRGEARRIAGDAKIATQATAGSFVDHAVTERWVQIVVAQVSKIAAALGVSMLRPGTRTEEEYTRWLDEAVESGGIFRRIQLAGDRIAQTTSKITALRELWSILETLEVYGWGIARPIPRNLKR